MSEPVVRFTVRPAETGLSQVIAILPDGSQRKIGQPGYKCGLPVLWLDAGGYGDIAELAADLAATPEPVPVPVPSGVPPITDDEIEWVRHRMRNFADEEHAGVSPLLISDAAADVLRQWTFELEETRHQGKYYHRISPDQNAALTEIIETHRESKSGVPLQYPGWSAEETGKIATEAREMVSPFRRACIFDRYAADRVTEAKS